ncbi:hypothetical protein [Anthropogastromicrobium sp.]|uniref:hypothetical protein n=1 Tax=Anthropogastromicrobium sp. TaxID=2981649 RepID=UPI00307C9D24
MQNKRWNRIRVGIAAVITSVSFASANTVSVECAKQITPETITEEPTTQDFMDLIEYTKDWQTAEEVTPESVTMEESQSTEVTQKDPMTMVPIKGIHACYGRIVEIRDNYILVQGLEENAINDQGIDWYPKSDVAAVSGYVDDHECTSVDDLKVGDFVCAIRFGYMHYTITNYFDGIAKFIVNSRDANEKAADKDLTRAAVHYAEKIAAKAADNDYLNKMELSDNAMQYAQSAAGLLNIVPEEIMEINLEDAVSSMFIGKININPDRLNIKTNLFGNLVNREVDEEMTAAFNALTEDEYLSTYYPLLSDGAVALWLYYGEKLPSVFTTFVPKSKIEGEKVKTSNTTEIRAILTEPSTYQQVCALMENGGEGDPIKTALARNADIYNDLDSFNPLNSNQGYYVGESKEAADETFYRTVAYDSIQSADCIKLISGLSNNVEQKLYGVQETLIAALTGVAPGTLEAYYVSKENNNQYVLTDIRNAAFNAMQDTTNQTAAWNLSQIIHSQMSVYSAREGWDRDVLLVYSFSDLTVLVTIEQGDNNFMKVTPLLVLTEENNENLGSQDQMDSFIQSLLEQYKFEKFDIAN